MKIFNKILLKNIKTEASNYMELTPIIFKLELTHLGLNASIWSPAGQRM